MPNIQESIPLQNLDEEKKSLIEIDELNDQCEFHRNRTTVGEALIMRQKVLRRAKNHDIYFETLICFFIVPIVGIIIYWTITHLMHLTYLLMFKDINDIELNRMAGKFFSLIAKLLEIMSSQVLAVDFVAVGSLFMVVLLVALLITVCKAFNTNNNNNSNWGAIFSNCHSES